MGDADEMKDPLPRHYSAYMSNITAHHLSRLYAGDLAALGYHFESREQNIC